MADRCEGHGVHGASMAGEHRSLPTAARSQRWICISLPPVATMVPSGEKAMPKTMPNCPRTERSSFRLHCLKPEAAVIAACGQHLAVGGKATARTAPKPRCWHWAVHGLMRGPTCALEVSALPGGQKFSVWREGRGMDGAHVTAQQLQILSTLGIPETNGLIGPPVARDGSIG